MNLYELTKEMNDLLISIPDEPTDEEVYQFQQAFLDLNQDFESKIDQITKQIKNLNARSVGIKNEIERLQKMEARVNSRSENLKRIVDNALQANGREKLETSVSKLSYRKSSKVHIYDESKVPDQFKSEEIEIKISKKDIRAALKNGEVPWAVLQNTKHLQIK